MKIISLKFFKTKFIYHDKKLYFFNNKKNETLQELTDTLKFKQIFVFDTKIGQYAKLPDEEYGQFYNASTYFCILNFETSEDGINFENSYICYIWKGIKANNTGVFAFNYE